MNIVDYFLSLGYRTTSPYGWRINPITGKRVHHNGWDFGVPDRNKPYNVPVRSPVSGVVRATNNYSTTRGLTVSLAVDGASVLFLFQHLASFNVKPGQRIKKGDIVGIFGTTGASTGIHLHFEIRNDDGSAIGNSVWGNPVDFKISSEGEIVHTIVLSAAHGGTDPGAQANGIREKDITLPVALSCEDHLNRHYTGHRTVMVRGSDKFISLQDRANLAQSVGAELYVAMHFDYLNDSSANGFGTHLTTNTLLPKTLDYSKVIHETVYDYVRTLGVRDRGMKRTNHIETRIVPVSAIIIEYMFISNLAEAALAKREAVLRQLGVATAEGIAKALKLTKIEAAPQPEPDYSQKFKAGDVVQNKASGNVNVRQAPGTSSAVVGAVASGQSKIIQTDQNNGVKAGNYYWWKIDRGWVAEDFFVIAKPPEPEKLYRIILTNNYNESDANMVRQELQRQGYPSRVEVI